MSLLPRQIISFSLVNKKKLYHTRLWPVELAMSWLHKTATIYKITSRLNVFSIKIYNITSLLDTFPLIVLFGCGRGSISITTEVVSSNPVHGEVFSIQHYVIKFVNDLWQVSGFIRIFRFPPPIKITAMIWLKYYWKCR